MVDAVAHAPAGEPAASQAPRRNSFALEEAAPQQVESQQICQTQEYAQYFGRPRLSSNDVETALKYPGDQFNLARHPWVETRLPDRTYNLELYSDPAMWYWQVTGVDWDLRQESMARAKALYATMIGRGGSQKQRERRKNKRKEREEALAASNAERQDFIIRQRGATNMMSLVGDVQSAPPPAPPLHAGASACASAAPCSSLVNNG